MGRDRGYAVAGSTQRRLRRSRYIGEAKTRLQELFIAIGMNLARIAAWLAGKRPRGTRTSAFVQLMTPACPI